MQLTSLRVFALYCSHSFTNDGKILCKLRVKVSLLFSLISNSKTYLLFAVEIIKPKHEPLLLPAGVSVGTMHVRTLQPGEEHFFL